MYTSGLLVLWETDRKYEQEMKGGGEGGGGAVGHAAGEASAAIRPIDSH